METDSTLEHCLVISNMEEVQVTYEQLEKISKDLKVPIVNQDYKQIVKSPFPLREICLENYDISNKNIKTL